jgi:hypothetical protein
MNWITLIWSMNAGACLTLAAFYGAVWSKQRENRVYLLFSYSAAGPAQGTIVHCRVPLEAQHSVSTIS